MSCLIVIPIHKSIAYEYELISFRQCISILKKHTFCVVTYTDVNIFLFESILIENKLKYKIEFFQKEYFNGLEGYNKLMLTESFYTRFVNYQFILIYQLDSFVFRDELDYWCCQDYDYMGAPWFTDNKSYEEGADLWKVGNGGFSLRKTQTFIDILSSKKNAYLFKRIYKMNKMQNESFLKLIRKLITGYENNINYLKNKWNDAEDLFFCLALEETRFKLKVPEITEAMSFAFEQSPAFLYEKNNFILPFGCHAWYRYDYDTFWSKYIHL